MQRLIKKRLPFVCPDLSWKRSTDSFRHEAHYENYRLHLVYTKEKSCMFIWKGKGLNLAWMGELDGDHRWEECREILERKFFELLNEQI